MDIFNEKTKNEILVKYKPNSHQQFIKSVGFCYRAINKKLEKFSYEDIENNTTQIFDALEKTSLATQSTYLTYVYLLYKIDGREFPKILSEKYGSTKAKQKVQVNDNAKKERSSVDIHDVYQYVKTIVDIKNEEQFYSLSKSMKYLAISILKEFPPRLNEFLVNLYWNDNGSNNYISIADEVIVIRNHKAMKSKVGTKRIELSARLMEDIKWYKKNQMKILGDFKFVFLKNRRDKETNKQLDEPMSEKGSVQFLRTIMEQYCEYKKVPYDNNKFGIHAIRASYFSKGCDELDINVEDLKKLTNLSKMMGHSSLNTTISWYYRSKKE